MDGAVQAALERRTSIYGVALPYFVTGVAAAIGAPHSWLTTTVL